MIRWGLREQVPWKQYGFQVVGEAGNGEAALELIPQLLPDIILTDIIMPVMNGIDFMSHVCERYEHIKLVVLSGYNEFEYARKCIEYRAFSYLLKPTNDTDIERVFLKARTELDRVYGSGMKSDESRGKMASASSNAGQAYSELDDLFHRESRGLMQEIVQFTLSGKREQLDTCLNRYFNLMENLNPGEEDLIFMKMVEFLLHLSAKAGENNLEVGRIYNANIHHEIRKIIEKSAIKDLRDWAAAVCDEVMQLRTDPAKAEQYDPVIEQVLKFLSDNYDRRITLDEVCDHVNISPSYFCSLFKQKTGETLMGYLTNMRMTRAKELLINRNLKIYEVAVMVGYDDFRHFSKTFRKMAGHTPQEYRERILKI